MSLMMSIVQITCVSSQARAARLLRRKIGVRAATAATVVTVVVVTLERRKRDAGHRNVQ